LVATPSHTTKTWRFGVFDVDAHREELRRAGVPIKLREQSFRILLLLLERAGELVSREDLRKALWPADTFVDFDHSMNSAVMRLREAIGDTADKPLYIETIPKRGYRFIAPLVPAGPGPEDTAASAPSIRGSRRSGLRLVLGMAIVVAGGAWLVLRPLPQPRVTDYVQLTHDHALKEVAAADENRLYINVYGGGVEARQNTTGGGDLITQLPPSGGELVPLSVKIPGVDMPTPGLPWGDFPAVYDLSPDGSTFLCSGPTYSLWTVSITGNPLRQLATAEGAAWSPDGKSVVYSWRGDIFVIRSDGSDSHRIVPAQGFRDGQFPNTDLSWSPDGGRIRFTRAHDLWEVSPSGANVHRLLPQWQPAFWKSYGRWTPDGKFFLFAAGAANSSLQFFAGRHLWAIDERHPWAGRAAREPFQMTSGATQWGHPIPSRDSHRIYARGIDPDGQLIRYDRHSQQWATCLGGRSVEFVTFSPDRKSVAFVAFPEEVLYRANRDGTGAVRLTEPPMAIRDAQWSPDGSRLAVVAQVRNKLAKLYLVPAQGGPATPLIPDDSESEWDPRWSPDGSRIVYAPLNSSQAPAIRIFDLTSKKITSIPQSGEFFSPR
jgi:DNA-binding winged helix-turn-helix (wHTH) protein/Tol biopolymer transport system component